MRWAQGSARDLLPHSLLVQAVAFALLVALLAALVAWLVIAAVKGLWLWLRRPAPPATACQDVLGRLAATGLRAEEAEQLLACAVAECCTRAGHGSKPEQAAPGETSWGGQA